MTYDLIISHSPDLDESSALNVWMCYQFSIFKKFCENIADSEQSSHTPGHSYQRYGDLIL